MLSLACQRSLIDNDAVTTKPPNYALTIADSLGRTWIQSGTLASSSLSLSLNARVSLYKERNSLVALNELSSPRRLNSFRIFDSSKVRIGSLGGLEHKSE